jgi:cysteine synthase A
MIQLASSIWDSVGQTPLLKIKSVSELTGCEIFGKAEYLNPGGSIKDRAAKGIIEGFEKSGQLKSGSTIVEGTAGNTGIGLATLAAARGYKVIVSMPDNQALEKYQTLEALGVEVRKVPPCPFSNEQHFYHQAKKIAEAIPNSVWANQFENTANGDFHFKTTGPEIWEQMSGKIDIVCLAVGTGGTLSGISRFLKKQDPKIKIVVADPLGSGLFCQIKENKMETSGSSITEGIGVMRLTANFKNSIVDDAIRITDQNMIKMLYQLARRDGLIVGTSAALNVRAAYELALLATEKPLRIVTFLCDHGSRYHSRVFNNEWLKQKGLDPI